MPFFFYDELPPEIHVVIQLPHSAQHLPLRLCGLLFIFEWMLGLYRDLWLSLRPEYRVLGKRLLLRTLIW